MTIELKPRPLFRTLLLFVTALLIANIVMNIIDLYYFMGNGNWGGNKYLKVLDHLFIFENEYGNIPTFYSGVTLLLCSILLWLIAIFHKERKEKYYPWLGLALIFCFFIIR